MVRGSTLTGGNFFLFGRFVFVFFVLFCFYHILPIGCFQFSHIASPHCGFMRHCAKRISHIKAAGHDA